MTAFLPNQDPNPARRNKALNKSRKSYSFNYNYVSPLAIVDRVPIQDEFSYGWILKVAERVANSLANKAEITEDAAHRDLHLSRHRHLSSLMEMGRICMNDLKAVVTDAIRFESRVASEEERPQSLEDYADIFHTFGLPPIAGNYETDSHFAWSRIAGPNPVVLENVRQIDDRFPVTDAEFQIACPHDSLERALDEGRVFIADYQLLENAELGDYPHGSKYCYAPLALFVIDEKTSQLLPVAIQCDQTPGSDNPIFTPDDGWNWLIAKTIVEVADGNMHEAFTHLGRTHFFMEPFVVTTFRQLAQKHPLAILLTPHFQGTLAINEAAWKHLIANKGAVDKLFGCSITSARGVAVKAVQSANIVDLELPKTFTSRGVDFSSTLKTYPYRDDALLYWGAIESWVRSYLQIYYTSEAEILGDVELQNWSRELSAQDGGRLNGIPHGGKISTLDELTGIVTLIIYTCSVQHAAVNFPQYDLMSYTPNIPLAAYTPAPTSKRQATEADYLNMLPPMDMAELQMELGYLLGTTHYTQLGQYERHHFRDHRVSQHLAEFQHAVSAIGGKIHNRNETRLESYETLAPSGIPQSINI